ARAGRGFSALLGDCRCRACRDRARFLDLLLERGGIGQSRQRPLGGGARIALRRKRGVALLLGGVAAFLHRPKRPVALGGRVIGRLLQGRKLLANPSEPVRAKQPLGRRRARALRNESVPAAHHAVARDEALANRERLTLVAIGDRDLLQPPAQLGRRAHMVGETFGPARKRRVARLRLASAPPARALAI